MANFSLLPITILSEFIKSLRADPSLKNSGLLATYIFFISLKIGFI